MEISEDEIHLIATKIEVMGLLGSGIKTLSNNHVHRALSYITEAQNKLKSITEE